MLGQVRAPCIEKDGIARGWSQPSHVVYITQFRMGAMDLIGFNWSLTEHPYKNEYLLFMLMDVY